MQRATGGNRRRCCSRRRESCSAQSGRKGECYTAALNRICDAMLKVASLPVYQPMDYYGKPYIGTTAEQLKCFGRQHQLFLPIWATETVWRRHGSLLFTDAERCGVLAAPVDSRVLLMEADGVARPLYNVMETSVASGISARVDYVMERLARASMRRFSETRPILNIIGRVFASSYISFLRQAASFEQLHLRCPRWVTWGQLHLLNSAVKPEETHNFIAIPRLHLTQSQDLLLSGGDGGAAAAEKSAGGATAFLSREAVLLGCPSVDFEKYVVFYNVSQVVESERFLKFSGGEGLCVSSNGVPYRLYSELRILEYCQKYHFPLYGSRIVFVTALSLHRLGGRVVDAPRFPLLTEYEKQLEKQLCSADCYGGGSASGWRAAAADPEASHAMQEGIVPPPLLLEFSGRRYQFFNALQTTIADRLLNSPLKAPRIARDMQK